MPTIRLGPPASQTKRKKVCLQMELDHQRRDPEINRHRVRARSTVSGVTRQHSSYMEKEWKMASLY